MFDALWMAVNIIAHPFAEVRFPKKNIEFMLFFV